MYEYSDFKKLERVDNKVFIKLLALLAVLEEHEFTVPVHEDQIHETKRIEQRHRAAVK